MHLFKIYKIKKATPHIIESLKEVKGNSIESTAKRGGYINTLGELGDTTSVTILWEIVNNSDVSFNSLSNAEDAAISLAKFGDYEAIKKVIKKIEIDSRIGKGNEKGLRNLYKRLTGEDYNY